MTDGETRIWVARTVWEIRSSSRHFRIVLPGWSDKAISPAIFSRSGNSMGKRHMEGYISVSKTLSALDETPPWALDDGASRIAAWFADGRNPQNPYTRPKLTASPRRVRGVAWSILGGSGPLDSGSNPDGPTYNPVRNLYLPSRRITSAWFGSLEEAVRSWDMRPSGRIRRSTAGTGTLRGVLPSPRTFTFAASGTSAARTTGGPRTSSS